MTTNRRQQRPSPCKYQHYTNLLAAVVVVVPPFFPSSEARCCSRASNRLAGACTHIPLYCTTFIMFTVLNAYRQYLWLSHQTHQYINIIHSDKIAMINSCLIVHVHLLPWNLWSWTVGSFSLSSSSFAFLPSVVLCFHCLSVKPTHSPGFFMTFFNQYHWSWNVTTYRVAQQSHTQTSHLYGDPKSSPWERRGRRWLWQNNFVQMSVTISHRWYLLESDTNKGYFLQSIYYSGAGDMESDWSDFDWSTYFWSLVSLHTILEWKSLLVSFSFKNIYINGQEEALKERKVKTKIILKMNPYSNPNS